MEEQENRPMTPRPLYQSGAAPAEKKPPLPPVYRWALPGSFLLGLAYKYLLTCAPGNESSTLFSGGLCRFAGREFYLWPAAGLFTLLFIAAVLLFCRFCPAAEVSASGERSYPLRRAPGRECGLWLAVLAGAGCSMTFSLHGALDSLLVTVIWHGAAVVWAASRTGQLTEQRTGAFLAADCLRCFGKGVTGLFRWPAAVFALLAERPRKKSGEPRIYSLFWFGGAAVLLGIALALLAAADDGFARVLAGLQFWQHTDFNLSQPIEDIGFGLFFGAFFYGLIALGTLDLQRTPRPASAQRYDQLQKLHRVQSGPIAGVLYLFSGVYLLFTCVQLRYLVGALAGRLPSGFTVAGYARQGFFQLCWVMLCNFALLLLAWLFARQPLQTAALRNAALVLLALSLLLWLTAWCKLGLYIGLYGFTPKRLQAVWALLVLATTAGCAGRSCLRPCPVLRPVLLTAAALLLPLLLWP